MLLRRSGQRLRKASLRRDILSYKGSIRGVNHLRLGPIPIELRDKAAIMQTFRKLIRDTRGATAIEYGLIAALIAVAAITAMSTLGKKLTNTFTNVSNNIKVS